MHDSFKYDQDITLICAKSFVLICVSAKWLDFRVKYSPVGTGVDVSAFWKVYKTLDEALAYGWVRVVTDNELGAITVCKSANDVRVCPLYDGNGFIAGMQLAVSFL